MAEKFSIVGNANEYAFARVISDYNERAFADGKGLIRTSQARVLHERFVSALTTIGSDIQTETNIRQLATALAVAVHDVISPSDDLDTFAQRRMAYFLQCRSYRMDYEGITGVTVPQNQTEVDALRRRNVFPGNQVLPVSPYDDRYYWRSVMRDNGTVLYANADELVMQEAQADGGFDTVYRHTVDDEQDINLFRSADGSLPIQTRGVRPRFRNVGPALAVEDLSGLSFLRPYMTEDDYNAVRGGINTWALSGNADFMSRETAERSANILKALSEAGYSYKIVADQNPGQLKAQIEGTKAEIRLMDRGSNQRFVGRVYVDGIGLYPTVFGRSSDGTNLSSTWTPSLDESVALIKYCLGERQSRVRFTAQNGNSPYIGGDIFSRTGRGTVMTVSSHTDDKPTFRTVVGRDSQNRTVYIGSDNHRNASHMEFNTEEDAREYLETAIASARSVFEARVNLDGLLDYSQQLIDWRDSHPGEDWQDFTVTGISDFSFDSNPMIEFRQREYLRVLLSDDEELMRPTLDAVESSTKSMMDSYSESVDEDIMDSASEVAGEEESATVGSLYDPILYPTNRERVRQHLKDIMDMMFGQFDVMPDGMRFDPAIVGSFMNSSDNVYRNNDNLIAAMRRCGLDGSDLRGVSFQTSAMKDHLLQPVAVNEEMDGRDIVNSNVIAVSEVYENNKVVGLDMSVMRDGEAQSVGTVMNRDADEIPYIHIRDIPDGMVMRMQDVTSPFVQQMLESVVNTVRDTGCSIDPSDVLIDRNGVVQYTATQYVHYNKPDSGRSSYVAFGEEIDGIRDTSWVVKGTIGQIFEPDDRGIVETNYHGSENKLFVPGYDARIISPTAETVEKPLAERVRLQGLEQSMAKFISATVRQDLLGAGAMKMGDDGKFTKIVGESANINSVYSKVARTSLRVHVPPEYEGETLTSRRLRELEMTGFPEDVDRARIDTLRRCCKFSSDLVDSSSIEALSRFQKKSFDQQVTIMGNDSGSADGLNLTGGQDLSVVSYFAEQGIADPYCTGSGKNQGKIFYLPTSAEVRMDGSIVPAKDGNSLTSINRLPYNEHINNSPADRNAMVDSNLIDAYGVASRVGIAYLNCLGYTYDDGAVISKAFAEKYGVIGEDGTSRPLKAGDKICDFSGNKSIVSLVVDPDMDPVEAEKKGISLAVKLFRDNPDLSVVQAPYAPVSRFNGAGPRLMLEEGNHADLTLPDGKVVAGGMGYGPMMITRHTAEDHVRNYDDDDVSSGKGRRVNALLVASLCSLGCYEILHSFFGTNDKAFDNLRENSLVLGVNVNESGDMSCDLTDLKYRHRFKLPTKDELESTDKRDLTQYFKERVDSRGGLLELPFPLNLLSGAMTPMLETDDGSVRYGLPIMSAKLRSGQRFEDGTSMTHDYTNQYAKIYKSCLDYMLADGNPKAQEKAVKAAQTAYQQIAEPLRTRLFDTKHNVIRDEIFSKPVPNSATAVWTPHPMLDLDQLAMNEGMMKSLGVKDGDYVLAWRDPLLDERGVRAMRVTVDNTITGVGVNPLSAKTFQGDFDGDSIGIAKLPNQKALEEAMMKLSFNMHLVDPTAIRSGEKGGQAGDAELFINTSMDVTSVEHRDSEDKLRLKAKYDALASDPHADVVELAKCKAMYENYGSTYKEVRFELEHEANEMYRDDSLSWREKFEQGGALLGRMSNLVRGEFSEDMAVEHLVFDSPQSFIGSLGHITDTGAKGSPAKILDCAKYIGLKYEVDDKKRPILETVVDEGKSSATVHDVQAVQKATEAKARGTGDAGVKTQQVICALRNLSFIVMMDRRGVNNPCSFDVFKNNFDEAMSWEKEVSPLRAGLYETFLATQGLLQAKHDPIQAAKLYDMVNGPIRDIWMGRSVKWTGDSWTLNYDRATGKPLQATRDEWIDTFIEMHESSYGLELTGAINRKHVELLADYMFDKKTGRMRDITSPDFVKEYSTLLDRMAYRPAEGWKDYLDSAQKGDRLFSGWTWTLAPNRVRQSAMIADGFVPEKTVSVQKQHEGNDVVASVSEPDVLTSEEEKHDRAVRSIPKDVRAGEYDRLGKKTYGDAVRTIDRRDAGIQRRLGTNDPAVVGMYKEIDDPSLDDIGSWATDDELVEYDELGSSKAKPVITEPLAEQQSAVVEKQDFGVDFSKPAEKVAESVVQDESDKKHSTDRRLPNGASEMVQQMVDSLSGIGKD